MSERNDCRLAVLMACHNRREKTLGCLANLQRQVLPTGVTLSVTLVDDGSTDGTAAAVARDFPSVTILSGDGNLFWCGAMRLAWRHAAERDPGGYLLLNDDTLLEPDAVSVLLGLAPLPDARAIAVAAIREPDSTRVSYGGVRRGAGQIPASGKPEICQTFNANCVLVPRAVFRELGTFHHVYTHGMGDYDYGFQATRRGISVVQSPAYLGVCPRNDPSGSWRDSSLPRVVRWRKLQSPKGLPFRQWCEYNRRNEGLIWPWRAISPYLRIIAGR